ncbi:MAG: hypothetical protein WDZ66_01165 [Steroidobacteraceae bacterium]
MSNGMSPRIRHIVSGLAAVATTALLMSTLVGSFDTRLLYQSESASPPVSAVTAAIRRNTLVRRV